MKRAVALGISASLLASGSAFAFWTSTGTGTGSSTSTVAAALTLTPGVPTGRVYPGGAADVAATLTNPNTFPVRVGTLSLDTGQGSGGFGVDGGHSGCGLSALGFAAQTNAGEGWIVPASGSLGVTLPGALSMATNAGNTCQSATFTVYLAASTDAFTLVRRTAGLISLWRLGTPPITADNFTGATGTALSAHSGVISSTWTTITGTEPVLTDANRLRRAAAGRALVATTVSPTDPDYAVEADLRVVTLATADALGVAGRITGTGQSWYAGRYQVSDNTWRIVKVINGVETSLASAAAAVSGGNSYRMRFDLSGTTLSLAVDGVVVATATDATLSLVGRAGLHLGVSGSSAIGNASGLHADNFRTYPNGGGAADSAGPNNGGYLSSVVRNEPGALAGDLNGAVKLDGLGGALRALAPTGLPVGAAPRSVELWFKRSGTSTATLFSYGSQSAGRLFAAKLTSATNLRIDGYAATRDFTLPYSTSGGAWHHVAVAYDGGTVAAYLDGASLGSQSLVLDTALDATGFVAGGSLATGTDFLAGSLDEVAVYGVALTATTVRDHYRAGHGS